MLRGGGQALVAARDDDERSALHYACGVGSEDCVRAILANGAEVDAKDKDSFTPLHIAAGCLEPLQESTKTRVSGYTYRYGCSTGGNRLHIHYHQ